MSTKKSKLRKREDGQLTRSNTSSSSNSNSVSNDENIRKKRVRFLDDSPNYCPSCNMPATRSVLFCQGKDCNRRYHISCIDPLLKGMPHGTWLCMPCVKKKIQLGVHAISPGLESIWDSKEGEEKQYFVKYKNLSHVHNRWLSKTEIIREDPLFVSELNSNFTKKKVTKWKKEWILPHRLLKRRAIMVDKIAKDFFENNKYSSVCNEEWLVKWTDLGYDKSTWEFESSSFLCTDEAKNLINEFESRRQLAKHVADPSFVNKALETKQNPLSKLDRLPDGLPPGEANDYLVSTDQLRDFWHDSNNALLIDEQERVMRTILFISSVIKDIYRPILIVSNENSLPIWESKFQLLVPSINVVTYTGTKKVREFIQDVEFYEETGCIMFQVLLSHPDAILDDFQMIECVKWEAVIVDECKNFEISRNMEKLNLSTSFRLLLLSSPLKDSIWEYTNILSYLDPFYPCIDETYTLDVLKERLADYIVYEAKPISSRFMEFWVPVCLSNVQLELYCSTLISCFKSFYNSDHRGLEYILVSLQKCVDHPYLVDESLKDKLTKDLPFNVKLKADILASGKFVLLEKILKEIHSHNLKILILYQYQIGEILEDFLERRFGKDSYEQVDSFPLSEYLLKIKTSSGCFIFLVDNRAYLPGVNLSFADAVVIFNNNLDPSSDIQLLEKIISLPEKKLPVFRLYSTKSFEEKLLLLATQRNLDKVTPVSHNLLSWGVSRLFNQPDEFHHSMDSYFSLHGLRFVDEVAREIQSELLCENNGTKHKSFLVEAHLSGTKYSTIMRNLECEKDETDPATFWSNLVMGRDPEWRFITVKDEDKSWKEQIDLIEEACAKREKVISGKHKNEASNIERYKERELTKWRRYRSKEEFERKIREFEEHVRRQHERLKELFDSVSDSERAMKDKWVKKAKLGDLDESFENEPFYFRFSTEEFNWGDIGIKLETIETQSFEDKNVEIATQRNNESRNARIQEIGGAEPVEIEHSASPDLAEAPDTNDNLVVATANQTEPTNIDLVNETVNGHEIINEDMMSNDQEMMEAQTVQASLVLEPSGRELDNDGETGEANNEEMVIEPGTSPVQVTDPNTNDNTEVATEDQTEPTNIANDQEIINEDITSNDQEMVEAQTVQSSRVLEPSGRELDKDGEIVIEAVNGETEEENNVEIIIEPLNGDTEEVNNEEIVIEPVNGGTKEVNNEEILIEPVNGETEDVNNEEILIEAVNGETQEVNNEEMVIEPVNGETQEVNNEEILIEPVNGETEEVNNEEIVIEPVNGGTEEVNNEEIVIEPVNGGTEEVNNEETVIEPVNGGTEEINNEEIVIEPVNGGTEVNNEEIVIEPVNGGTEEVNNEEIVIEPVNGGTKEVNNEEILIEPVNGETEEVNNEEFVIPVNGETEVVNNEEMETGATNSSTPLLEHSIPQVPVPCINGNTVAATPDPNLQSNLAASRDAVRAESPLPAQIPVGSWSVFPQLHSDPLKNELFKIKHHGMTITNNYQHTKMKLRAECEEEIVKIRKKYDDLEKGNESTYKAERKRVDDVYRKLYINQALAEQFQVSFFKQEDTFVYSSSQDHLQHPTSRQQILRPLSTPPLLSVSTNSIPPVHASTGEPLSTSPLPTNASTPSQRKTKAPVKRHVRQAPPYVSYPPFRPLNPPQFISSIQCSTGEIHAHDSSNQPTCIPPVGSSTGEIHARGAYSNQSSFIRPVGTRLRAPAPHLSFFRQVAMTSNAGVAANQRRVTLSATQQLHSLLGIRAHEQLPDTGTGTGTGTGSVNMGPLDPAGMNFLMTSQINEWLQSNRTNNIFDDNNSGTSCTNDK